MDFVWFLSVDFLGPSFPLTEGQKIHREIHSKIHDQIPIVAHIICLSDRHTLSFDAPEPPQAAHSCMPQKPPLSKHCCGISPVFNQAEPKKIFLKLERRKTGPIRKVMTANSTHVVKNSVGYPLCRKRGPSSCGQITFRDAKPPEACRTMCPYLWNHISAISPLQLQKRLLCIQSLGRHLFVVETNVGNL